MSIPAETPAAVITLPSSTTRSRDRLGAQLPQSVQICPVGGGALAVQDPRRAEDQRARAHRRRPGGALVRGAQPVQHLGVPHQGPVADAAGYQHHFRGGQLAERQVGLHAEGAGVGSLSPGFFGDEAELRPRQARQHLVGADRVQRREPSKIRIAICMGPTLPARDPTGWALPEHDPGIRGGAADPPGVRVVAAQQLERGALVRRRRPRSRTRSPC